MPTYPHPRKVGRSVTKVSEQQGTLRIGYGRRMSSTQPVSDTRPRSVPAPAALLLDALGIVLFCAIGRRSHDEGITLAGVWHTAWPFLSGGAVGWLVSRGWVRPASLGRTGVTVWVCTVLFGMILRRLSNQVVALSFVIVASLVTGLFLLGWRVLAERIGASRGQSG